MPLIVLTFNYPSAPLPQYKFGDRVALIDKCSPDGWLTGKVVGLTLDENYQPYWYYSVKLDAPSGLTEEYSGDELVPEKEVPALQAEWDIGSANWVKESCQIASKQRPIPKFDPGMRVTFKEETGFNLLGDYAEVVSSRYVSSEDWSGWVYQLTNEYLDQPIEIGETWLDSTNSGANSKYSSQSS